MEEGQAYNKAFIGVPETETAVVSFSSDALESSQRENNPVFKDCTMSKVENDSPQLYSSSSDISIPPQFCSEKHTDSSFCSDSSHSGGNTSVYRQTPTYTPTLPTYNPIPPYQP